MLNMSKTLCKAIIRMSFLETKYFKTRSNGSLKAYNIKKSKNSLKI